MDICVTDCVCNLLPLQDLLPSLKSVPVSPGGCSCSLELCPPRPGFFSFCCSPFLAALLQVPAGVILGAGVSAQESVPHCPPGLSVESRKRRSLAVPMGGEWQVWAAVQPQGSVTLTSDFDPGHRAHASALDSEAPGPCLEGMPQVCV